MGRLGGGLLFLALVCICGAAYAAEAVPIDCLLRDEPYSVDSPLMDILLNPAAGAGTTISRHGKELARART